MRTFFRTPIPALGLALLVTLLLVVVVAVQRSEVPQAEASQPSSSATTPRVKVKAAAIPRPDHVVVVVLENKHRSSVIGSSEAPFLNALAQQGANMSASYGVTHPSQPNYIALFSGSQQGFTSNECQTLTKVDNLGRQLLDAGLTFTGYAEAMPQAGYTGCEAGDRYRRKHNPWVSFDNLPPSVNQPFSEFPSDYDQLPTVAFVAPEHVQRHARLLGAHRRHLAGEGTGRVRELGEDQQQPAGRDVRRERGRHGESDRHHHRRSAGSTRHLRRADEPLHPAAHASRTPTACPRWPTRSRLSR